MNNGKPDFPTSPGASRPPKPRHPPSPTSPTSPAAWRPPRHRSTPAAVAAAETYTVAKGDNPSKIARHFYGRRDWKRIFDANRDQLDDPDKIFPARCSGSPRGKTDPSPSPHIPKPP